MLRSKEDDSLLISSGSVDEAAAFGDANNQSIRVLLQQTLPEFLVKKVAAVQVWRIPQRPA